MSKRAKIIKADNKLRQKAGYGEIADRLVSSAEKLIESNQVDFPEIALPILTELRAAIAESKETGNFEAMLHDLINPVMELKANGPMFKFHLVGNLASVMLSFLEHIDSLDSDAIEIIEAHEKTLSAIVGKGIKGDGGPLGAQLVQELEEACSRYYRKNPDKFKKSPRMTPQA